MDQHQHHTGEHKDNSRLGHMQRTMDRLSDVVTADLIVDFGVLVTGVILVLLELGLFPHRPFEGEHAPQEVVVRRVDDTPRH